ncbi:MAG: chromosome segregation protein SMC [Actinobacteria bacterium]|nr:chromosome segregation protein SMC [Actinomycetota bacterium]MSW22129.1 chromosome segregation protein SMC [Actinomycetota bacterium]MSX03351.1 chromosome segregation protein SMC [Actinomycetota bacterium]MSX83702.1 chromosome segregation protein SMC [Actinomycetota bacterium]MUH54528.1 chromosome segregation protein SMC [Actinomycetota bacterium]
MTLKGFKSFASSTSLNFEPGITCVVGPNGSGKSNVVDALSWVMGEQGAKSLRGGKMEDVIFAGTSGRAPLGRAEVSVTIDNTDGVLPIDFTEVTISRILFRNGASEYQLNGDTTRLLDIQELLSDTGIGREMHVIVGQGQLDAILLANPEERRAFIEEAAGVLKHRKRKEKALRKLDSMTANLARIQDLTVELRRQLKPLGKQAEVARKASTIQSDVRDSRLRLLADDLLKLRSTVDAEVADESALRARRDGVEAELNRSRAREEEIDATALIENPLLVKAQENYYQLTAQREKFRGIQNLASERARFLSEEADEARASGRDPESMDLEAAGLRGEEQTLKNEVIGATSGLEKLSSEVRTLEANLISEENSVSAALRAIADQREGTARQEGHINGLKSRIDATNAEITRLTKSKDEAAGRLQNSQEEFALLETQIASVDANEPGLDAEFESAKSSLAIAQTELSELELKESEAQRTRSGLDGRLRALQESLVHRDGSGVVLTSGTRTRGRLSSLINIAPGWEVAVSAALGPLADSVVVSDISSAVSALTMLKREGAGQSELLVIDGDSGFTSSNRAVPSGFTSLSSLVSSSEVSSAIAALLSGFVAVEDLAEAESALRADPSVIAITRDGDVLSRIRVRGGSSAQSSAIEISALIEKTESQLQEITNTCDRIKFEVVRATETLASRKSIFDLALSKMNESDAKISGLAEQMAVAGQNVKSAQGEVERVLASLAEANIQRESDEADLSAAISQFESHQTPVDPDLTHLEDLRSRVSASRSAEVEARLNLRTLEERVTALIARASALETAAQNERDSAVRAISRREQRGVAALTAQGVADAAYEALIQIESSIAKASTERERLEISRSERESEILALRVRSRELTTELDALTSSVHRDEIARAEQRLRIEALEQKAIEELGVDVSTLVNEYGPENGVPTFVEDEEGNFVPGDLIPYRRDQQEKRLAQAERSLVLLGKINPLALEEYSSLEERLRYLAEQLEDLKKTKRDLLDIIKEVDDKVQQIFKEAFDDTAREFELIFERLFPGGDGRLILTNPEDMTTAGVDVEARPPGKRIKRLSLLSGGERSLVAVALLIAIFKARPSPFYVMDEVEAALDDTNLGRLLGVFEELREKSQLIVITHQKRTMEIADSLYGVTMRGDGVSEVISQRIRESESAN